MSKVKSVVIYLLTANPTLGEAFVKVGPKAEFQDESVPFFIGVSILHPRALLVSVFPQFSDSWFSSCSWSVWCVAH
jgi:hypothetical protein